MADTQGITNKTNSPDLISISKLEWTATHITVPGHSRLIYLRYLSIEKVDFRNTDIPHEKYRLFIQRSGETLVEVSVLESERDLLSNLSQKLIESKL